MYVKINPNRWFLVKQYNTFKVIFQLKNNLCFKHIKRKKLGEEVKSLFRNRIFCTFVHCIAINFWQKTEIAGSKRPIFPALFLRHD